MLSTSAKPYTQRPICLDGRGIHSEAISCLDFLDEDRRIITCSEDGSIQVREVDTGQVVSGPWTDVGSGAIHAMAVSPNHMEVVTGSQDGKIRLWTVATGKMTGKWKQAHSLAILSVCWSPDELHIASGSEDGTAIIWDTKQGDIVGHPIRTAHPHVYAVHYSSDGTTLVTSGYNNTITFWDVKTREALRFVEACHASQQVHCVIWTSYDRIFLGCSDGIVQTRANTQGKVARLGERTSPICAMVLSQDELLLATVSLDNTISLWDPKTNHPVGQPFDHPGGLRCAAFARNSRLLATSGVDKNVYIWNLQARFKDVRNITVSESGPSLGTSTAGHSLIHIDASICPTSTTRKDSRHSDTDVVCLASPSNMIPHVQLSPMARIDYQGILMRQQTFVTHRLPIQDRGMSVASRSRIPQPELFAKSLERNSVVRDHFHAHVPLEWVTLTVLEKTLRMAVKVIRLASRKVQCTTSG